MEEGHNLSAIFILSFCSGFQTQIKEHYRTFDLSVSVLFFFILSFQIQIWMQHYIKRAVWTKRGVQSVSWKYTGCFNTLARPLHWTMVHTKTTYFQDPISIPDYHASFQNYSAIYLHLVLWFMCQGRAHFHAHFLTVFLGWLSKNGNEIVNNWIRLLYHTSF